jgi:hypothetical protein
VLHTDRRRARAGERRGQRQREAAPQARLRPAGRSLKLRRMPLRTGWRGAALCAALALGCESAQRSGEALAFRLNPFGSTEVEVRDLARHGPHLFADLQGPQLAERLVAPDTPVCARVLQPGASVRFEKSGNFGRLVRGEEACEALGTLALSGRRERQPRRRGEGIAPRSTARYTLLHRDEHYLFLRGRFALVSRVGIPAAFDLIAILPQNEACRAVAARSEATLEFRAAAREPLRLLAGGQSCVPAGFATPVPTGDDERGDPTPSRGRS